MRNYTRKNPINRTVGITFVLLLISLGAIGYSYSSWSKNIFIQTTVTTARAEVIIASDKLFIPTIDDFNVTYPIQYHVTAPENHTLVVDCENVGGKEWIIKIGLVVKNNGTMPIYLTGTTINFISSINLQATTYCYNFVPSAYWDGMNFDNVPPDGYVAPPIQLEPNDKAITWTVIKIIDSNAPSENVQITATPEFYPFP